MKLFSREIGDEWGSNVGLHNNGWPCVSHWLIDYFESKLIHELLNWSSAVNCRLDEWITHYGLEEKKWCRLFHQKHANEVKGVECLLSLWLPNFSIQTVSDTIYCITTKAFLSLRKAFACLSHNFWVKWWIWSAFRHMMPADACTHCCIQRVVVTSRCAPV